MKRQKIDGKEYYMFALTVFEQANWRCQTCGKLAPLQVHHNKKRSQGGKHTLGNCIALCPKCHEKEHR